MFVNQDPTGGAYVVRSAHYTGYNINATAGSRTVITAALQKGDIVQLDPYNQDGYGLGLAVAKPTAGQVGQLFVVIDVPNGVNDIVDSTTGRRRGGRINVAPSGVVQLRGNATTNAITVGALLSPYTGNAFHLEVSSGTTVAHMKARVSGTINDTMTCGVALEALESGSGLILAQFGPCVGAGGIG